MVLKNGYKKIILSIVSIFRKIKVKFRLMISFLILSIVPLVFLGFFSYNLSKNSIETKIEMYYKQIMSRLKTIYSGWKNIIVIL